MKNKGWAIHCHHNKLVEYCYSFKERVDYIREYKPKSEIPIRLKLFKLLPDKAIKEIPQDLRETDQKHREAWQKWKEANQKYRELDQKLMEADQKYRDAWQEWREKEKFHKKWCGCKFWVVRKGIKFE